MQTRQMGEPSITGENISITGMVFFQNGSLSTGECEEILRRRNTLDRNDKLSEQLLWLHECGFSEVDVVFKNRTFIVTVVQKT